MFIENNTRKFCYVFKKYNPKAGACLALQGNDDAGQMSAWLVMSSIGIYQVCPGCGVSATSSSSAGGSAHSGAGGEYVLSVPLFDNITLHLPARQTWGATDHGLNGHGENM